MAAESNGIRRVLLSASPRFTSRGVPHEANRGRREWGVRISARKLCGVGLGGVFVWEDVAWLGAARCFHTCIRLPGHHRLARLLGYSSVWLACGPKKGR